MLQLKLRSFFMNNKARKTVTYSAYENDILISETYPDGSVKGEFAIINTHLGFQLRAYYDSWKVLNNCNDLLDLLANTSMAGITMRQLADMIKDIGYDLSIR